MHRMDTESYVSRHLNGLTCTSLKLRSAAGHGKTGSGFRQTDCLLRRDQLAKTRTAHESVAACVSHSNRRGPQQHDISHIRTKLDAVSLAIHLA